MECKAKGTILMAIVISLMMLVTTQAYSADHDFPDYKKENGTARCTDGIDNDLDELIDACDPDCTKNRNEKKLLKWDACTNDESALPEDEAPFPDEEPDVWTPEGNLLLNPFADFEMQDWLDWGDNGISFFGDDPAFYVHRNLSSSHMAQDYILPRGSAGKYVVFAGYVMTGDDNENIQKARIWAYFMDSPSTIIYPIVRANMMATWCGFGCWQPAWGVYEIPNKITRIRLFLDEAHRLGDGPTTAYFDDIEMRLFDTSEEAYVFVDSYIEAHPEGIR